MNKTSFFFRSCNCYNVFWLADLEMCVVYLSAFRMNCEKLIGLKSFASKGFSFTAFGDKYRPHLPPNIRYEPIR